MIEGYGVGEGRSAFCGTESSMFAGRPLLFLYARIMRRRCMMVVSETPKRPVTPLLKPQRQHHQHLQIPHSSASPAAPTANAAKTTLTLGPPVAADPSAALLVMLACAATMLRK